MSANRILYRVFQFWKAFEGVLAPEELEPARAVLSHRQMSLFEKLHPSEQRHSLRVMRALQGQGENHPDLLKAALLHDVGKTCHPLRPFERVLIVLSEAAFPRLAERWGQGSARGWRRPFVVAKQHPKWGAEMSADADVSPITQSLIRRHQEQLSPEEPTHLEDRLLVLLQRADDQS
ncbi:MAG: HD domain-containing protein [Anaerolineales bacterium]|jgi:hypothetical protein